MREQRHHAMMIGPACVRVESFVQRWRSREGIEEQDNPRQHRGEHRLAGWFEMAIYEPHN